MRLLRPRVATACTGGEACGFWGCRTFCYATSSFTYLHPPARHPPSRPQYILAHLSAHQLHHLPAGCPLRPELDLYLDQERHKSRGLGRAAYKCGYCGKAFKDEASIDKHMERHHGDKVARRGGAAAAAAEQHHGHLALGRAHDGGASGAVCLAELCDVLQCEWFAEVAASSRGLPGASGGSSGSGGSVSPHIVCTPQLATRAMDRCEALVDDCFASDDHRGHDEVMRRYVIRHFCGSLTCDAAVRDSLLRGMMDAGGGFWTTRRVVLLVVVLVALAMFYGVLATVWAVNGGGGEQPGAKPRRQQGRAATARIHHAADMHGGSSGGWDAAHQGGYSTPIAAVMTPAGPPPPSSFWGASQQGGGVDGGGGGVMQQTTASGFRAGTSDTPLYRHPRKTH